MFLLMLDGAVHFTSKLNGQSPCDDLDRSPSEYFKAQVRVAAFSYERPGRLRDRSDSIYMCCSDYPHSEGTATPIDDYRAVGADPDRDAGLFHDNVSFLLRSS
jgi:hypothetical protein